MSSIGGYKPGDQIGLGTVVRPADIKPNDVVKQVTVDIDLDGQVSQADDKILVKLPPKGVAIANLPGFESKSERASNMTGGIILGGMGGGFASGVLTFSGAVIFSKVLTASVLKTTGIGVAIGIAAGAGLGALVSYQGSQIKLEKAQDKTVPDLVKPKMILNINE